MSLRALISLLLTLLSGYLLYEVAGNWGMGSNPYLLILFCLLGFLMLVANLRLTKRVAHKGVRTSLRILLLLGVLVPVASLFFRATDTTHNIPPRRYTDSAGYR